MKAFPFLVKAFLGEGVPKFLGEGVPTPFSRFALK